MRDSVFEPKTVTVPVGTTVTWRNTGRIDHTATADDGSFDRAAAPGDQISVTFDRAGTYGYYCKYHGAAGGRGMAGTIVVTAAQASPSASPSAAPSAAPSASPSAAPSAAPSAPPAGGPTPSIKASNQPIVNGMITVDQVVAAQDGWVAVHKFGADGKMLLTPLAGLAQVKAGTTSRLRIKLDESFPAGAKLAPMLHVDEGVKGTYEFPNGPDVPAQANGNVVMVELTVQQAAAQPPAQLPNTGALSTSAAALAVLAALTLLAGLGINRGLRRRNVIH